MAFGARQVDGVWVLCLRKGQTIDHAGPVPIRFKSQARAKACADALNEEFWETFQALQKKRDRPEEPEDFRDRMVARIKEFME